MERSMDISFDFRIEDFRSSKGKILESKDLKHPYTDSNITFSVTVFPDGADKETEGWLVVLPNLKFNDKIVLHNTFLSWIVSIIDINDESMSRRSFGMEDKDIYLGGPSRRALSNAVYLKRDFILREENEFEFLPGGVLTLRCDISFSWYEVLPEYPPSRLQNDERYNLRYFLFQIRDLTTDYLKKYDDRYYSNALPFIEELLKIMEVGIWRESQSEVWSYNSLIDSILHFPYKSNNSFGARLLEAYPVIKEWVNEEHSVNRIQMTNLDGEIFIIILLLLMLKIILSENFSPRITILDYGLRGLEFNTLLNIYKFSHLFEIKWLEEISASEMSSHLRKSPIRSLLEKELEGISFIYSDKYLFHELHTYQHAENYRGSPLRDFFSSVPQSISSDTFNIFDLTEDIRKLKDRYFNCRHSSRRVRETHSKLNEDSPDITESIWIFETFTDKFRLSFNEYKRSLGVELLNASKIIRQKVTMKGRKENRIELPEVDAEIFKIVLYYLMFQDLYEFGFHLLVDVYKFAKRNEMEDLKRDCAAEMFETVKAGNALENELEKNRHFYSDDEYFLELLRRRRRAEEQISLLRDFFSCVPQSICSEMDDAMGHSKDAFTVYDLTKDIREMKDFPFFPKKEECPHILKSSHSELNEKAENIEKNICIFSAYTDQFYLSFNEYEDSLGIQLLNASPVIRKEVNNAMKERKENRIRLSKVDSETFKIVLYYLLTQQLHEFEFHQLVKVYEFAEKNEMEDLRNKCSTVMFEVVKAVRPLEKELDAISYVYSDKYLSKLLLLRRRDDNQRSPFENFFSSIPMCSETNHSEDTFTVFDFTPDFSEVENFHLTFRKYLLDRKRRSESKKDNSNVEEQDSTVATHTDKFFQSLPKDRQESESKESFHSIFHHIFKKRCSKTKEESLNVTKQVWIFDTHPDRFLLSLPEDRQDRESKTFSDDRQDSVGFRLLEASNTLQSCFEAKMKEKEQKHVELSVVDSETFKIVMFFLISGILFESDLNQLLKVYQFSDYYMMEELKRTCAEEIVKHAKERRHLEKVIEEIKKIYSDKYLQWLFNTRLNRFRYELEERELQRLRLTDNLLFHCFI